jgi:hypothetical protein
MPRSLRSAGLVLAGALWLAASSASDAPVPHRECAFEWIPWSEDVEAAKERAEREDRLVLAFLFPWDGKAYEGGYAGAEAVRRFPPVVAPEQAAAQRTQDPGYAKEQAALLAWLGDPETSALVARSFVPVRLRLHTWHFFDGGPGPFEDALPSLGTSARETRPPAVVVAAPDGKAVRRFERIGVFASHHLRRVLLATLAAHPRRRPKPATDVADLGAAVAELLACGDLAGARKRVEKAAADDAEGAALHGAALDLVEGKLDAAEAALRPLDGADARRLRAHVALRRGRHDEVASTKGLDEDDAGRAILAAALERLGRPDDARAQWSAVAQSSPDGPLGARARWHLASDGPRAAEWDTVEEAPLGADAATTIAPGGGTAAAVRWLLDQQMPDGSWRAPRDAGGPADLVVPRTALCVSALRAWRKEAPAKRVDDAIERGVAVVDRWSDAPSQEVWSLTYALHLQLELLGERSDAGTRRRARNLLDGLRATEHDGGWTYTGPARLHTFNTAPILLLLVRARELDLDAEPAAIERAAKFLERNRVPKSGVFHYGTTMEHMSGEPGKTDAKSTCMRSALCELALLAAGAEKGTRRLEAAVDLWFDHQPSARATQKIFESYVDVTNLQDSYRYYFGTWYAARAIARLPEAKRKKAAARLAEVVRATQECDGSFVDSQMVGKCSSTALALLALAETAPRAR